MDGAGAFLSRICLPAAEEFGLLLKDKVSRWRAQNLIRICEQSEKMIEKHQPLTNVYAHPRLVTATIESGSWADHDKVQGMWAGLLASSCTEDGKDESNLLFINLLSQITSSEALIFNHACESVEKTVSQGGWINGGQIIVELNDLIKLTLVMDIHRLDRELDHLRSLDLMHGGFDPNSTSARLMPTPLGLHMYVRCQGYVGSPIDYFGIRTEPDNNS
jgi:hypothetical protein